MLRAYCLAGVVAAAFTWPASAQDQRSADPPVPAGSETMRIGVELTGLLKVTPKGAELTFNGWAYNGQGEWVAQQLCWKVDLSRSAKLQKKAEALNGKEVVIEGTACVALQEYPYYSPAVVPVVPLEPQLRHDHPISPKQPEGPPDADGASTPPPPPPLGPYMVPSPTKVEKSYRLVPQREVKVTSLRAKTK